MTDFALGNMLWLLYGVALGAIGALSIAWQRGAFNPVVKVTIGVRGIPEAPVQHAAQFDEKTVVVHPVIHVTWDVIHRAAEGAGMVVVPRDMAPPRH